MFGLGMPELAVLFVLGAGLVMAITRGGGGSLKRCVFCQSNIPKKALVCKHCQRDQPS